MSGRLFAFDQQRLTDLSAHARRVLTERDTSAWRDLWHRYREGITNWGCPDEWSGDSVPSVEPRELALALRLVAFASALRRAELWEKAWHVHYPALSDDDTEFCVSESDEYEAVGLHVFSTGQAPPELAFLGEPGVATNWIAPRTVSRLWALEQNEAFLAKAGATLDARGTPLGHDLLTVRRMLQFAVENGAALFLWDPGT